MQTQKLESNAEFMNFYSSTLATFPVIVEGGGGLEPPTNYPCIIVYDFVSNPYLECEEEREDFEAFKEEGYYDHEIELFKYHYVYLSDFV